MQQRFLYTCALVVLTLLWVFMLAVPNLSASETEIVRRLNRTVVTQRLSGLGFTHAQAESAVRTLDAERLAHLASGLGTERRSSPFIACFAILSFVGIFGLLILTH